MIGSVFTLDDQVRIKEMEDCSPFLTLTQLKALVVDRQDSKGRSSKKR